MSEHYEAQPPRSVLGNVGGVLLFAFAVMGAVQFLRPNGALLPTAPLSQLAAVASPVEKLTASPGAEAFGRSGHVMVRFSLPGERVEFPLALAGSTDSLTYQWEPVGDSASIGFPTPLSAAAPVAPLRPGFYRLAITRGSVREVLAEPTLAVMWPFNQKMAGQLNGYRIGTYLAERLGQSEHERPDGFVEVREDQLDLPLSKHLKLSDFVTHDDQGEVWPKYVVLNPKLLDKLELVLSEVGANARPELAVDVHSGFRTPSHNARVPRAAGDSRHQYGDAADVTVDADGDGRITMTDELLVMLAVERVEDAHPDLVGGLGLYMSSRYRNPYVHIDTRGKRTRWKG